MMYLESKDQMIIRSKERSVVRMERMKGNVLQATRGEEQHPFISIQDSQMSSYSDFCLSLLSPTYPQAENHGSRSREGGGRVSQCHRKGGVFRGPPTYMVRGSPESGIGMRAPERNTSQCSKEPQVVRGNLSERFVGRLRVDRENPVFSLSRRERCHSTARASA